MRYGDLSLTEIHALIKKVGELEGVRRLLRGETHVVDVRPTFILDTDRDPDPQFVGGMHDIQLEVVEHDREGLVAFTIENMYTSSMKDQFERGTISTAMARDRREAHIAAVRRYRKERLHFPNVVLRDFLLQHRDLIPEEWRGHHKNASILFLGTLLRHPHTGVLMVPTMLFSSGSWIDSFRTLDSALQSWDSVMCHNKADSFITDDEGRLIVHRKKRRK